MAAIPAARRRHYQPNQRFAILELRAARGWSLAQTARVFQVSEPNILRGESALMKMGRTLCYPPPTGQQVS